VSRHIGRNIRDIRKARGLTQEKLAGLIDSQKSYVWKIEKETPKDVSLNKISKIADVLGVSVDSLLQETLPDLMDIGDEIAIEKFKRLDENRRLKVKEFIELLG